MKLGRVGFGVFLVALLLIPLFSPVVHAVTWWDAGWMYKAKLTIDETKVDADLTDFPVLVYLNSARIDWVHVQDDLDDLRFLDSTESTVLKAELEKSVTNSEAWIWVKVPVVSGSVDTVIYVYYGNAGAASAWDAENVWDSSAVMVQHMYDNPDTSHVMDSTSYSNDGTKKAANEPIETASGKIDSAQSFDSVDDYINRSSVAGLNRTALTFMFWSKQTLRSIFTHPIGLFGGHRATIYINSNSYTYSYKFSSINGVSYEGLIVGLNGNWHFIAVTFDGAQIKGYTDGALRVTRAASGSITGGDESLFIATIGTGSTPASNWFNGIIDEVRIYNIAKSAAWIKAEYNSGADTLLTISAEELYPRTTTLNLTTATATTRTKTITRLITQTITTILDTTRQIDITRPTTLNLKTGQGAMATLPGLAVGSGLILIGLILLIVFGGVALGKRRR